MHHRKTYMYINFQHNRVSRSVKTVHTNLFTKICNLQLEFQKITPLGMSFWECPTIFGRKFLEIYVVRH